MLILILGLVVFLGIHSVRIFADGFRENQIAKRGLGPWKGIYTLVAIVGLVLIVWGYGQARLDPVVFWTAPSWMNHLTALLMVFSLVFFVTSHLPAGKIKAAVKHPLLLSAKIWALAHLLVNGDLTSILLFGSFLAWAVLDRIAVKKRVAAGKASEPVAGPVKWDAIALVGGLVLYAAFAFFLHNWLFGVSPFPVAL